MLSMVGGLSGIVLALVVGASLTLADIAVAFALPAIVGAFACAVITGVVFGFMPARKAARLDPVKALTSE
ncbi:Macrolide export ATP-binding/permease protein MacB [compost metagenome]